jgi:hypothetical protein
VKCLLDPTCIPPGGLSGVRQSTRKFFPPSKCVLVGCGAMASFKTTTHTACAHADQSIDLPRRVAELHVLVNQLVDEHQLPLQATNMLHHNAVLVPSGGCALRAYRSVV